MVGEKATARNRRRAPVRPIVIRQDFCSASPCPCIATDKPFAGCQIKRQGGTLFMAAEAAGDIPIRLQGLGTTPFSNKQASLPFAWVDDVPTISKPGAFNRLVEIAREAEAGMRKKFGLPLALIAVDTMAGGFSRRERFGQRAICHECAAPVNSRDGRPRIGP
jgi:hypothetical protein